MSIEASLSGSLVALLDDESLPLDVLLQYEQQLQEEQNKTKPHKPRRSKPKPSAAPKDGADMAQQDVAEMLDMYDNPEMVSLELFKQRRVKKRRQGHRLHGGLLSHELEAAMGAANMDFAMGNFPEAMRNVEEVVAKLPDHAPAWTLLGTIHEMQGNKQQAIQAFVIGLHCNAKDGQTWKKLAYLYKDDGDLSRAVDAAVRAVKLCPEDFMLLLDAASWYAEKGDLKRSIKIFLAALDNPVHPCPNPLMVRMRVADLAEQVNDFKTMEKMLHAILTICLPTNAALEDASQNLGTAVTTVHEALQGVVPIVMSEDEDDEEGEEEAPSAAAPSAAAAAASASGSAHSESSAPAAVAPQNDPVVGFQAAVKLAGLAVSQGRYEFVQALLDTVQAYVDDHPEVAPAGSVPLELTTYAGMAALYLGQREVALERLKLLWQAPDVSATLVQCYALAAKALLECGYAQVARVTIKKVRELCEVDVALKAEWTRELTLLEADAYYHEENYEMSLACYKMFDYDFSRDGPLLVKYLKTLFKAGMWPDIAAAVFTTGPAPLSIIKNDAQRATLLFDAALWCRSNERLVNFVDLLSYAIGAGTPAAPAPTRLRMQQAVVKEFTQEAFTTAVEEAYKQLVKTGFSDRARRLITMIRSEPTEETSGPVSKRNKTGLLLDAGPTYFADMQQALAPLRKLYEDNGPGAIIDPVDALRKVAPKNPYNIALWNLLHVMEGAGKVARPDSFHRVINRAHPSALFSIPFLMEVGNSCLQGRSYRLALGVYAEAYRLIPEEPLLVLCIAMCFLSQVKSRVTTNRHRELVRAFTFLNMYKRLRLRQASGEPLASLDSVPAGIIPRNLPLEVLKMETTYNLARACHQISIVHIAATLYEEVLHTHLTPEFLEKFPYLDLRREAAYNYVLLLNSSQDYDEALAVTEQYLTY